MEKNTKNLKDMTRDSFEKIWNEDSQQIKYQFGIKLYEYSAGKYFDYNSKLLPDDPDERQRIIYSYRKTKNSSSAAKQFHRLSIGYYGVRSLTPKRCNLISKNAKKYPSKTTSDHVIGATTCSQYVLKTFNERLIDNLNLGNENDPFKVIDNLNDVNNSIIDMCNNWLFDHMWLWAQCKITVEEHLSDNLPRIYRMQIDDEISHKLNLQHYNKANIIIENY